MLSVNTNLASLEAQKNLSKTQSSLEKAISHLSAGLRITTASDDAAGLAKSMQYQSQIAAYNQAARNANDGISAVQTAEGYLNEVGNILTRLRELATKTGFDAASPGEEVKQLGAELDRINSTAGFTATATDFQVGIGSSAEDTISFKTATGSTAWDVSAKGLNLGTTGGDVSTVSIANLKSAIDTVAGYREYLGAMGNRVQSALNTIQTASTNTSAANSRIIDVDVAEETSKLSRAQVLAQSGVSVLAQANQLPQMALKLLG